MDFTAPSRKKSNSNPPTILFPHSFSFLFRLLPYTYSMQYPLSLNFPLFLLYKSSCKYPKKENTKNPKKKGSQSPLWLPLHHLSSHSIICPLSLILNPIYTKPHLELSLSLKLSRLSHRNHPYKHQKPTPVSRYFSPSSFPHHPFSSHTEDPTKNKNPKAIVVPP